MRNTLAPTARIHIAPWAILLGLTSACLAQQDARFEVASIRISQLSAEDLHRCGCSGKSGGPGTDTPTRVTYSNYSLGLLLLDSMDAPASRIVMGGHVPFLLLTINANVREGTTKEEFRAMLRNLLADRFHLKTHQETRTAKAFNLVIDKRGHKMKLNSSTAAGTPLAFLPATDNAGPDGLAQLPQGRPGMTAVPGRARIQAIGMSMAELARDLSPFANASVADATNSPERFDFLLEFDPEMPNLPAPVGLEVEPFPPLSGALADQLGLRLEKSDRLEEFIVVDAIDPAPTPN